MIPYLALAFNSILELDIVVAIKDLIGTILTYFIFYCEDY